MGATSHLELPVELKHKIEEVAKERNEEPASLIESALDSLLGAEQAQLAELRRRDLTDSGQFYTNEQAFAKLDSLRPSHSRTRP